MKAQVDLRYFYQGIDGCMHYSCGMAFQVLLVLYRKQTFQHIRDGLWTPTFSSPLNQNPVVKGFLAEQACLATIRRHGLGIADDMLSGNSEVEFFSNTPA